jgi:hypothetical protein
MKMNAMLQSIFQIFRVLVKKILCIHAIILAQIAAFCQTKKQFLATEMKF